MLLETLEISGSSVVAPPVPTEPHADSTIGRSIQKIIVIAKSFIDFFIFLTLLPN